jgi:hypothetical protein
MSLEASAPHRMIQGASAVGARCKQRAQITHSHGVTPRRSERVVTGVAAILGITGEWGFSLGSESRQAYLLPRPNAASVLD